MRISSGGRRWLAWAGAQPRTRRNRLCGKLSRWSQESAADSLPGPGLPAPTPRSNSIREQQVPGGAAGTLEGGRGRHWLRIAQGQEGSWTDPRELHHPGTGNLGEGWHPGREGPLETGLRGARRATAPGIRGRRTGSPTWRCWLPFLPVVEGGPGCLSHSCLLEEPLSRKPEKGPGLCGRALAEYAEGPT